MKVYFTFLFLILIIQTNSQNTSNTSNSPNNEQQQNTHKYFQTDEFDPNKSLPPEKRRPDHLSEKSYCDTCLYFVNSALRELAGKKSEMDIIDVFDRILNNETLDNDKYIPNNFITYRIFVEHLIGVFEEDLVKSFIKGNSDDHIISLAC